MVCLRIAIALLHPNGKSGRSRSANLGWFGLGWADNSTQRPRLICAAKVTRTMTETVTTTGLENC